MEENSVSSKFLKAGEQNGENLPETRMERKKRTMEKKIIDTAIGLFREQGFEHTTMEQIALVADVARRTLYNYFPVKEAIVDAYVRNISRKQADQIPERLAGLSDTRSRLIEALNSAYTWVEENKEWTGIVLAYRFKNQYQNLEQECEKTGTQIMMEQILEQGIASEEIRSDLSVKFIVLYLDLLRGTMVRERLKMGAEDLLTEPIPALRSEITKLVDLVLYGVAVQGRTEEIKEKGFNESGALAD